jgi:hypothetical protein
MRHARCLGRAPMMRPIAALVLAGVQGLAGCSGSNETENLAHVADSTEIEVNFEPATAAGVTIGLAPTSRPSSPRSRRPCRTRGGGATSAFDARPWVEDLARVVLGEPGPRRRTMTSLSSVADCGALATVRPEPNERGFPE